MASEEKKSRIIDAANELVVNGNDAPTNTDVRNHIGKGSLSDIAPVMRQWREERKNNAVAVLNMPIDLKISIEHALSNIWTTANKLTGEEIVRVKNEAEEKIGVMLAENEESMSEIKRLEKIIEDRDSEVQCLKNKNQSMSENVHKLETINTALTAKLEAADEKTVILRDQLTEAHNQNKTLIKSISKNSGRD